MTTLPTPPERDLYSLAQQLVTKDGKPLPRVANQEPVTRNQGDVDTFWITDLVGTRAFTAKATLVLVSEHAYWYVQDGVTVSPKELTNASKVFEERIYPQVTAYFGTEWSPGVDNDPRITILHARLRGVAGYYSSADEYPTAIQQYSNQREMIYINVDALNVGSALYLGVLAHEFMHAAQWPKDPTEETWVNEGLAEVASKVAGYPPVTRGDFLKSPTTSLVNWAQDPSYASPNYGGAYLFLEYLAEHYGGYEGLRALMEQPQDSIEGVDAYLAAKGYQKTFRDVFADWIAANYLDATEGIYRYAALNGTVPPSGSVTATGQYSYTLPQYSANYIEIQPLASQMRVSFQGQASTSLLPTKPHSGNYCWWSNRGDSINSSLTRKIDLSRLNAASLSFWAWYDIEEGWDYLYVEVSKDGGQTWDILSGTFTSPKNPVGTGFGPGITGKSQGWVQEKMDLSKYTGGEVLLRFQYITDDALNEAGACIDDVAVPEIVFQDNAETEDAQWDARGFVRSSNEVAQTYIVRLIEQGQGYYQVRDMPLDSQNHGSLVIAGVGAQVKLVTVVVSPVAPGTLLQASYTLTVNEEK